MTITRIESLTYGVTDMEASQRYFDDWGLQAVERGQHGVDYRLPSGQVVRVRRADDRSLAEPIEAGSTVRNLTWGVADAAALQALGTSLAARQEVAESGAGVLVTTDPSNLNIGFTVAAQHDDIQTASVRRMNEPFRKPSEIRPHRIGHAVFNVAPSQIDATSAFYRDVLDFRLSERVVGFGDFLRAPGSRDHHNLFVLQKADSGLNHVAFEVPNVDHIVLGGKQMVDLGWKSATNLGRHIMGANLFWYFHNPGGGLTEYFSDMDLVDDRSAPQIWETNPGFAMWMN